MAYSISYKRKTVSQEFRAWLMQRMDVGDGTEEWRFLYYLLLGNSRDGTGLVIPQEACAEMEFEELQTQYYLEHIYVARHFLERMQARFPELGITWIEASIITARRTRTLQANLPIDIQTRLTGELEVLLPEASRVYFLDGTIIDRRKKAIERTLTRNIAIEGSENALSVANSDQRLLFNYLNNLDSNQFTKAIRRNLEATKAAIALLPEEKRERELNLLENIEHQPQPFYKLSQRTTRLAPIGSTIASLKTPIRKALTEGWVEMDLRNVQLAINAKVWNLPQTQAFLEQGHSWWNTLFEWFGLAPNPELKQLFKNATYALCFGATKRTITNGQDGTTGLGEYTNRFFEHPIVREIWLARRRILREIRVAGGYPSAYGNQIMVDESNDINTRSVLAQVSQSYEQMLIAEIFKLAYPDGDYHDDFKILLYQYDGVSVSFRDSSRQALWLERIQEAVKNKAQELGIHTELVF